MAYSLNSSFSGHALLNGFNWFDQSDLSQGSVAYQSKANAEAKGLFSVDENTGVVRLKVDHEHQYSPGEGRPSIRLESREQYNHGLFIADFLHMPPSRCVWAYGSDWPKGGEIDIIEGVNTMKHTSVTAHTIDGCTLQTTPEGIEDAFSGIQAGTDCGRSKENNIGCGFDPPQHDNSSYGDGFNAVDGGVYAMLWNSKHMKVWHFPRGDIPSDIEAKRPDPKGWKTPMAVFGGSECDIDSFFKDLKLIININFCGDWGNALWGKKDDCNLLAPTCAEYVARTPEAFVDAYWDIQYIDTYQLSDDDVTKAQADRPVTNVGPLMSDNGSAFNMTGPPAIEPCVGSADGGIQEGSACSYKCSGSEDGFCGGLQQGQLGDDEPSIEATWVPSRASGRVPQSVASQTDRNALIGLSAGGKNLSSPECSEAHFITRRPANGNDSRTWTAAFQLQHTLATEAEASVQQTSTQVAVPTSLLPLDVLVTGGSRVLARPALMVSVAVLIAALKW
ncbi:glycoside hydrolase family 16 protein [Ophiocordyceps camponoti-floridani]|uniref:Glycoside hydrolase family 16 protein n=1 Tax=Ophiocordyceps camponoti-floridani TaxID=2030778 RepID=A0A8H4QBC1_9HYPO|nr:glycoside hydrolase family 16 protein [Ophiocordyceps camponoti-floridani]